MPSYRIYRVAAGGRLVLGEAFHGSSDAEAIRRGQVLQEPGTAAELWDGGRLVGRFSKQGAFTPASG